MEFHQSRRKQMFFQYTLVCGLIRASLTKTHLLLPALYSQIITDPLPLFIGGAKHCVLYCSSLQVSPCFSIRWPSEAQVWTLYSLALLHVSTVQYLWSLANLIPTPPLGAFFDRPACALHVCPSNRVSLWSLQSVEIGSRTLFSSVCCLTISLRTNIFEI